MKKSRPRPGSNPCQFGHERSFASERTLCLSATQSSYCAKFDLMLSSSIHPYRALIVSNVQGSNPFKVGTFTFLHLHSFALFPFTVTSCTHLHSFLLSRSPHCTRFHCRSYGLVCRNVIRLLLSRLLTFRHGGVWASADKLDALYIFLIEFSKSVLLILVSGRI